jgi:hypothetical protein
MGRKAKKSWKIGLTLFFAHTVNGHIQITTGEIEVSVSGSAFPSHALFLDGELVDRFEQGDFAELWKLGNIEMIMR